jgi:predicted kinase
LEQTGDYSGLSVLRYYLVYRALVRAKVMALRARQSGSDVAAEANDVLSYLRLARHFTEDARPAVILTHGVSGSGKSTLAQRLLQQLGAVRVRSDVERKRLSALASTARTGSALDQWLYSPEASHATYEELARLARIAIEAGYPVIVDAAFLQRGQRDRFRQLAAAMNVPFAILDCRAPVDVLHARVSERERRGRDPSEANASVLAHQLATREPLGLEEQPDVIVFSLEQSADSSAYDRSCHSLSARIGQT